MGRALFSQNYTSAPAVRTEPEPSIDPFSKWSRWNAFDPDSDEFFDNAVDELFIDTEEYKQEQERISLLADGGTGSPVSSESSGSDRGSPMAVGSDDPAVLIADAYSSLDWEQRFLAVGAADAEWRRARDERQHSDTLGYPRLSSLLTSRAPRHIGAEASDNPRPGRISRSRSTTVSGGPAFHPPSSLRNSTTATEISGDTSTSPQTNTLTVNVTPMTIPIEPSTPSPLSPQWSATPYDTMFSPSPAPVVTPRIYSWNHRAVPRSPTSPSSSHGSSGPLTNPGARMSLPRINIAPTRVHVQNA
jgi:hypothetical protein